MTTGLAAAATVVISADSYLDDRPTPDPGQGKAFRAQRAAGRKIAEVHHETRQQRRARERAAAKAS